MQKRLKADSSQRDINKNFRLKISQNIPILIINKFSQIGFFKKY